MFCHGFFLVGYKEFESLLVTDAPALLTVLKDAAISPRLLARALTGSSLSCADQEKKSKELHPTGHYRIARHLQ
jgi:hypothetical protein